MDGNNSFQIRTKRAFRWFDSFVFSVILSLPLILLTQTGKKPIAVIMIISSVLFLVVIVRRRSEDVSASKKSARRKRNAQFSALMLLDDKEIGDLLHEDSFYLIRREKPDLFDLLNAVRSGAKAVGVLEITNDTESFFKSLAPEAKLISKEDIMELLPDTENDPGRSKGLLSVLTFFGRINKYIVLGCILFLCSFFVKHKIYFRAAACLSAVIAPISGFFSDWRTDNKMRIFLDK